VTWQSENDRLVEDLSTTPAPTEIPTQPKKTQTTKIPYEQDTMVNQTRRTGRNIIIVIAVLLAIPESAKP
jgi:hypothetical protein